MRALILTLTLGLTLAACTQTSTPISEASPLPERTPLGLVSVSVNLGGTATARVAPLDRAPSPQQVRAPAGLTLTGRSVAFFDDDVNGVRYVTAEFDVRNDGADLSNLTLVAFDVANGVGTSVAGTAVRDLRNAADQPITANLDGVARAFTPTHAMINTGDGVIVNEHLADFQAIPASEVRAYQAQVDPNNAVGHVLGYGFTVRPVTPTSGRTVAAGTTGRVAFSYKLPLSGARASNPWAFTLNFLAVDERSNSAPVQAVTQSLEEQTSSGNANVAARLNRWGTLGGAERRINVFPGSTLSDANASAICSVKTAAARGALPEQFLFPPKTGLLSVAPAANGIVDRAGTNAVTAAWCDFPDAASVNAGSVVVTGSQTGRYGAGSVTARNGRVTFALPSANDAGALPRAWADFKAGENVTVQLTSAVTSGGQAMTPYTWSFLADTAPSDGTFNAPVHSGVGSSPRSVALGDVNGDGRLDLVTANGSSNNVSVLRQNTDGTFTNTNVAVGTGPQSVALGDLDGDGRLDLVTANNSSANASVLRQNADGTFTNTNIAVGSNPRSVALGDVNGDGRLDIVAANYASDDNIKVLLQNADGSFPAASPSNTFTTSIPGTPYTMGFEPYPQSVALGDVDRDGRLDIVAANYLSDEVVVLRQTANGTFPAATSSIPSSGNPRSVTLGDVDGDGRLDVVVANAFSTNVTVARQAADGSFPTATSLSLGYRAFAVALGDVNGDGRLDLATANSPSNNVSVLRQP